MIGAVVVAILLIQADCLPGDTFMRVCYFPAWARERNTIARFDVKHVDPKVCTHLVYSYAVIDLENRTVMPIKPEIEEGSRGKYREFNDLKRDTPELKTLLSIRAQGYAEEEFVSLTSNHVDFIIFSQNVKTFLRERNFDGVNIDWRYVRPRFRRRRDDSGDESDEDSDEHRYTTRRKMSYTQRRRTARDKEGVQISIMRHRLVTLVSYLRYVFDKDSTRPKLILNIVAPTDPVEIDGLFDIIQLSKLVDHIYLRTFEYSKPGDKFLNFRSPLFASQALSEHPNLHMNFTVHYWHVRGMPNHMMIAGVSGMGRRHVLKNLKSTRPGSGATGELRRGKYYEASGLLAYPEVCEMLSDPSAEQYTDGNQMTPYLVLIDNWVGYEDASSLITKVKWMKKEGLGGILFYYIDADDFTGEMCGLGKYPLLNAIASVEIKRDRERSTSAAETPRSFLTDAQWSMVTTTSVKTCRGSLLVVVYLAACFLVYS